MRWFPIESAPKDEMILVGPTKILGMCVAMNDSRDGWVTETCFDWHTIYPPTHWMPLPPPPSDELDGLGLTNTPTPEAPEPLNDQEI